MFTSQPTNLHRYFKVASNSKASEKPSNLPIPQSNLADSSAMLPRLSSSSIHKHAPPTKMKPKVKSDPLTDSFTNFSLLSANI